MQDPLEKHFDPSSSPTSEVNCEAAKTRGLRWNPKRACYVDEDGCMIRDKFGQPY